MSLTKTFIAALALSLCGHGLGAAVPNPSLDLAQRHVPADPISKYTTQWFLDHTLQKPNLNECVFYTRAQSKPAQQFANDRQLATIWAVWAPRNSIPGVTQCSLYNDDTGDTNNPLRGIMANSAERLTYFTHMSQAYAELCSGQAYLMSATPNIVPIDGIWFKTEFPTLKKTGNPGGRVNVIAVTDPQGRGFRTYWRRPGSKTKRSPENLEELFELALVPTTCLTPDQIEKRFGDINW